MRWEGYYSATTLPIFFTGVIQMGSAENLKGLERGVAITMQENGPIGMGFTVRMSN
jgi:hypothetical protein